MSIVIAFIQHLLTVQPLREKVADRIDAGRSSQNPIAGAAASMVSVGRKTPRLVITQTSDPGNPSLTGQTSARSPRLQVDIITATYVEALAIEAIVRDHLDGFRGMMHDTFVDQCLMEDPRDFDDPSPGLDEHASFGRSLDFVFIHQAAVPAGVPPLEF